MKNYAYFVSCSWNYVPYLNALLSSLHKYNNKHTVYLLTLGFQDKYLNAIQKQLGFQVFNIDVGEDPALDLVGKNLFMKQRRFKMIEEFGMQYDAICMLDADQFISSQNFNIFFDLVRGTNKLIGCEEAYKWEFNDKYRLFDEVIFKEPIKAYKFMCSVPIFFDLKQWQDVFSFYNKMAFNSYEVDSMGMKKKRIGDIYTWSISIYKNNRQNDCILLPMHAMTQVHGTAGAFWCGLNRDKTYWYAGDGCEVYSIHGRIGTDHWKQSQRDWYTNSLKSWGIPFEGKIKSKCNASLDLIENYWYELNFNGPVILDAYYPCENILSLYGKEVTDGP
jgi:hypothetical protein